MLNFAELDSNHLVNFFNIALRKSKRNYCAADKLEIYALVQTVGHICMYLQSMKFLLRTKRKKSVTPAYAVIFGQGPQLMGTRQFGGFTRVIHSRV